MKSKVNLMPSILLGLSLSTWAISAEGTAEREFVILLPDGGGLREGADVQCRGVRIGKVSSVFLHEKKPAAKIVLKADAPKLTESDRFRVDASSLLGDRVLTVVPGQTDGRPLENGKIVGNGSPESAVVVSPGIELTRASEAMLRLFSELSSLPDEERKKAVDQCLEMIKRQKNAANDSVLGGANKPPAPVKPGP
jgi:hypothetical protein